MEISPKPLLIIFYRNPRIGTVKTRLAATMGNEIALEVFKKLAEHTRDVTEPLRIDKVVYYSEFVDPSDIWPNDAYQKAVQEGNDLGERMANAFAAGFEDGYKTICIIGTDCFELTADIIEHAYSLLKNSDAVIGPALDGGYYLLGMRKLHPAVFQNKRWSTDTVLNDTLEDFRSLRIVCSSLQVLRDVDTEDDLPPNWNITRTGKSDTHQ